MAGSHSAARSYPVLGGRDVADPRFGGLAVEVAGVLTGRGYPELTDEDYLTLRTVLFVFLYGPAAVPGGGS